MFICEHLWFHFLFLLKIEVMTTELENGNGALNDATRQKLRDVSKAFLRFHKTLLDAAKAGYEAKNGAIANANSYLQLVLDDPHFAWLRKISSLVALLDEAPSLRRPASELEAQALLGEAKKLIDFKDADEDFNDKLQTALQNNSDAVAGLNDVKNRLG